MQRADVKLLRFFGALGAVGRGLTGPLLPY